jgi:hypothetical protein
MWISLLFGHTAITGKLTEHKQWHNKTRALENQEPCEWVSAGVEEMRQGASEQRLTGSVAIPGMTGDADRGSSQLMLGSHFGMRRWVKQGSDESSSVGRAVKGSQVASDQGDILSPAIARAIAAAPAVAKPALT